MKLYHPAHFHLIALGFNCFEDAEAGIDSYDCIVGENTLWVYLTGGKAAFELCNVEGDTLSHSAAHDVTIAEPFDQPLPNVMRSKAWATMLTCPYVKNMGYCEDDPDYVQIYAEMQEPGSNASTITHITVVELGELTIFSADCGVGAQPVYTQVCRGDGYSSLGFALNVFYG